VLGGLGYAAETDWLPSRIELRSPGDRWVDVHPVAFDEGGSGRQADIDSGYFEYPPDAFGRGLIAGRGVGCLSARSSAASAADTSTAPKTSTTSPSSTPFPISKGHGIQSADENVFWQERGH